MNKTSIETRNRVFEYWLEGKSRNHIAKKLGISTGNVTSIINSQPSSLKPLRDLALTLKKHKMLPIEAKQGVDVLNQLKEVDIKPEQTKSFIQSAEKLSKQAGYQPTQVIQAATTITQLEAQSGKTYPQIIVHHKKLTQENQELNDANKQLQNSIKANKQKENQAIKDANTTIKQVNMQQKLIEKLQEFGINFNDLGLVKDFLQNIKDSKDDPKRFLELTKNNGALNKQINIKKTTLKQLKQDVKDQVNKLDQANETSESYKLRTLQENRALFNQTKQAKANLHLEKNKIHVAQTQLANLKSSIKQKQALNKKLSEETAEILNIKNYATEQKLAIIKLQNERKNRKTWITVADLMQSFFTNAQTADFSALKYFVNQIEHKRNQATQKPDPTIDSLINELDNFIKNYLSNKIQPSLIQKNKKLEKENINLKTQLQQSQTKSNPKSESEQ